MSLPKVATVTHELTLPSTGKKIKYRPFLVKEEKVLIMAQESGSDSEMNRAMREVIEACVLTKGFDIDSLATFDLEYLFLNVRGRSVGEEVEVIITCPDDNETKVNHTIYLDEVKVVKDPDHTRDIKVSDDLTLRMKYPTLDQVLEAGSIQNVTVEESFDLIVSCIDMIFSKDESWNAADSTHEELLAWLDELEPRTFRDIEKFFTTMPKLSHTITVTNPNTGVESEVVLEGMGSFFA